MVGALAAFVIGLTATILPIASAAQAVTGSDFDPGYIISDERFFDSRSMDEPAVQAFLASRVPDCIGANGLPCLKDARFDNPSRPDAGANHCGPLSGGTAEPASRIIVKAALACRISPQVLIVMLQKEQGLVTATSPTERQYRVAMGYACPDTADCDSQYFGFANQVYRAAWQMRQYTAFPDRTYRVGSVPVQYHPNAACGAPIVNIRNQATANLYNYTPYQPNAAALANLRGTGDACSSYGNRNFWVSFWDWFGSPTNAPAPTYGAFDELGVTLRTSDATLDVAGWAFDPAAPTSAIDVHVHMQRVGGHLGIQTVRADLSRPDVGRAYPAAGPNHGFDASLPVADAGDYHVCVYAIRRSGAVAIGCRDITVTRPAPFGSVDDLAVRMSGGRAVISTSGWVIDQLQPTSARRVDVWVESPDGRWGATSTTANLARVDVGAAHPTAGPNHGFALEIPITRIGTYTACVFGIGTPFLGDNNVLLRCADLRFGPSSPTGVLDVVSVRLDGTPRIDLAGWGMDEGLATTSTEVHVWVTDPGGNRSVRTLAASQPRPDVGRAFPAAGANHGFSGSVTITREGQWEVCAYGIGAPVLPYAASLLGCRKVSYGPSQPLGAFDTATAVVDASGVRRVDVAGWAFDRAASTDTTAIDFWTTYPNGFRSATHLPADRPRPDVGRAYPGAGDAHGVTGSISVPGPGSYQVCAYAIGSSRFSPAASGLGCRTVVVP